MTDEDVDENDEYEAGKEEHNHKETQRKRKDGTSQSLRGRVCEEEKRREEAKKKDDNKNEN